MKKNMIQDLKLVEIELFSYCNRQCNWCPNREIDRHSNFNFLNRDILFSLIDELKENDYKGAITFSRYNEPMSDIIYLKNVLIEIKKILPYNKLITNTNGDFISYDNINELLIDELTIMDYDNKGIEYCKSKLESCGATILWIKDNYIYATINNTKILYYTDWTNTVKFMNRGSFLKEFINLKRDIPCYEPSLFVGINYDGSVSPCCHIRNDIDNHKEYIIGNLNNNKLNEILNKNNMEIFKNNCKNGIFKENSPCYNCEYDGGRFTKGKGDIFYE